MSQLHSGQRRWAYLSLGLLLGCLSAAYAENNVAQTAQREGSGVASLPWFTGPLITSSGTTYPDGEVGLQYFYSTESNQRTHLLIASWGIGKKTDLQWALPYSYKHAEGLSGSGFGDVGVTWGYQLFSEDKQGNRPALKVTATALLPTGKFDRLNADKRYVSGFGSGAYRAKIGLTAQKLIGLKNGHLLRARWNVAETLPASASVQGISVYGGTEATDGTFHLGQVFSTALGLEYTLWPRWVAAMDLTYSFTSKTTFSGVPGKLPPSLDQPSQTLWSIVPALEYNLTASTGFIVGVNWGIFAHNVAKPSRLVLSFETKL